MKSAPAFDCARCGRHIGKTATHYLIEGDRVVCSRCIGRPAHAQLFPGCPEPWHDTLDHSARWLACHTQQEIADAEGVTQKYVSTEADSYQMANLPPGMKAAADHSRQPGRDSRTSRALAMSNRRRLRPPASILAAARAYQCGHCNSITGKPRRDADGIWHIDIRHDDTCPALTGAVSRLPAGLRAATAAAASTGATIAYLSPDLAPGTDSRATP